MTTTHLMIPPTLGREAQALVELTHRASALATDVYVSARYNLPLSEPDWQALFPEASACPLEGVQPGEECECPACSPYALTARNAARLHATAVGWAENCLEDLVSLGTAASTRAMFPTRPELVYSTGIGMVASHLPFLARSAALNQAWMVQLAHAFHLIAARLAAGQVPYPRCTGEEMALHLCLGIASGYLESGESEHGFPVEGNLQQWAELSSVLFQDEDVLELFDPALDGIEDSDLALELGMAHLHPTDWFIPFAYWPGKEDD